MYGYKPFSYSPSFKNVSQDGIHQLMRPMQQDEPRGPLLQRNSMFRPNGKSIYMQRKEYSDILNKRSENIHVRVEHLMTCELDGQELKTLDDCLAKLKRVDAKGRLWPQEMIMEVQQGYLLLSDIETKVELEVIPLRWLQEIKAVLDSCAYNSLLTLIVDEQQKRSPQVYMFQCEETGAELIKADLDKIIEYKDGRDNGGVEPRRDQSDIKTDLEAIIGKLLRQSDLYPVKQEVTPPPPLEPPPPLWRVPESPLLPRPYSPQDSVTTSFEFQDMRRSPEVPSPAQVDSERNMEIFNHILNDLEVFLDKIPATQQQEKSKKKSKIFKKKSKTNDPAVILPPVEEYISCLQKVKYGFNLLGQLEGSLSSPSASDFVHIFFNSLNLMITNYPDSLPPSVVSPLLTAAALQLLRDNVSPEEEKLWVSLGDSWNLPRSRWSQEVPPYIPVFYDGWQPPYPSPPPYSDGSRQVSRNNSQRFSPRRPVEEPMSNGTWDSMPPPAHPNEPPLYMRAIYDFMSRNNRELSIMKGETVQVVQKSKQWWLVRNNRGEEGNVPPNVLEPLRSNRPMEDPAQWNSRGPVTLDMNSRPAEVKAWLEYKGFTRLTANTLGVLTGEQLLDMSKEDIRTVCPEEGSKVFFQLQGAKTAIALANEPTGLYNRRY